MKTLLQYLPLVLFFAAYKLGDIYSATIVLVVSLFAALGIEWLMTRKLNRMLFGTALLALVLGAATFAFHDPAFIKLKPTLIYAGFAAALLGSQFIGEQPLIQRLLGSTLDLPAPVWRKLNVAWMLFFAGCALLNWYVASHYSEATWVNFKLIVFTALPFVFALAQAPFLMRYLGDEDTPEKPQ